ncbi:MAG: ATP-binding protein [Candidatus Omnitrophota bacterium]
MKISFGHRIIFAFLFLAALSVLVGYLAFITTKNLQKVSRAIMKENVSSLKAAEELELALLNQKGIVASYFLDGNLSWLKTLEERKKDFDEWFAKASDVALTSAEKTILQEIGITYKIYDSQRNRAVRLYQSGNPLEAQTLLLNDVRKSIDALYQKCEDLILENEFIISKAEAFSQRNAAGMTAMIWITVVATLCLGGLMGLLMSKKINEQLIRSAKMATLGQLSANVAHEIRNPLTSIKMRLYTLEEELKHSPLIKEDISIINEEINRMEKTVKNFLDFARLPEPSLQKSDIHLILERTTTLLSLKANAQNVKIENNFRASQAQLNVDREQMQQLFLNIMLNAIEAMPEGGVLEVMTQDASGKKLKGVFQIGIKDAGIGISPEFKKRLFEPFFTTKAEGIGLGLFIASRIVQLHHGTIEVHSRLGKGTVVMVKLPFNI